MIFRRTERRSPWYNAVIGEILRHIIWRLQVSRQHPSADVDNLVNEIFEILMEMETKGIDPSSFELYFDKHWQLHNLRALPPEVSAERLRKFMSTLQKRMESDNIALIAAAAELAGGKLPPKTEQMAGMPFKTVFVLCERRQRQNVTVSALLDWITSGQALQRLIHLIQPGAPHLRRAMSPRPMPNPRA